MEQKNDDLKNRFTAWIELVVKHARADYMRSLKRRQSEISIEDVTVADDFVYESISLDNFDFDNERLNIALKLLTKQQYKIIELLFIHSLTSEEAAKEIGCTVQHIYNLRSLALKKLRKYFDKGGE